MHCHLCCQENNQLFNSSINKELNWVDIYFVFTDIFFYYRKTLHVMKVSFPETVYQNRGKPEFYFWIIFYHKTVHLPALYVHQSDNSILLERRCFCQTQSHLQNIFIRFHSYPTIDWLWTIAGTPWQSVQCQFCVDQNPSPHSRSNC